MSVYKTMELDDATIAYREEGNLDATPVLFLHGYPTSSALWQYELPIAAALGYRAVAPDLPGFGHSDLWRQPAVWRTHIDFVERFRAALGLENLHLAVHDWGGPIGLGWLLDHMSSVQSLFITNTTFFSDYEHNEMGLRLRDPIAGPALIASNDLPTFARRMRRICPNLSDETIAEWHLIYSTPERRQAQLDLYGYGDPATFAPYTDRLAGFSRPVTIVWGAADSFIPVSWAQRFAALLTQADVQLIEGAGHFVQLQEPQAVADIFEIHLKRAHAALTHQPHA